MVLLKEGRNNAMIVRKKEKLLEWWGGVAE